MLSASAGEAYVKTFTQNVDEDPSAESHSLFLAAVIYKSKQSAGNLAHWNVLEPYNYDRGPRSAGVLREPSHTREPFKPRSKKLDLY